MRGSNHPVNTLLNIPHTNHNDSDSQNSIIKGKRPVLNTLNPKATDIMKTNIL